MQWNKTLLRITLIVSFLGVNALILFGISSVWSYLNTGAERSERLHLDLEQEVTYAPTVKWDTAQVVGRSMEKETLSKIERDYLNSWLVKNTAFYSNNPYGVADYFTYSARAKIYDILEFNKANGNTFEQTSLEHHPQLKFYSADGTQIAFTDHNVRLYRKSFLEGKPMLSHTDTESYQVIMLLEDGFWRVRHFVKIPDAIATEKQNVLPEKTEATLIPEIKGINYYPKDTPWDTFGIKYNDSIITSDFRIIRKMGLNTVRIFIPYANFGGAEVDRAKLQKVRSLLDIALEQDLKVMVTLFDFYGNYEVADWTMTYHHAQSIVLALKDHPALLAWDLKNEPDLDFESRGKENVLAWLEELAVQIKKWDPTHPFTVGWSSPEAATNLSDKLDFVSFHYYKDVEDFLMAYKVLRDSVQPSKAVVLQEYGISSYGGIWNVFRGSEDKQASYYNLMQSLLQQESVPYLFWTLYDFEEVPTSVVGRLPWRRQPQKYFGCFDNEGKEKKSYELLRNTAKK